MTKDILKSKENLGAFFIKNEVVDDNHIAAMGHKAFAVYTVIKRHITYGTNTGSFPSYTLIAERTGMNRTQISDAIKVLLEGNYIEVDKEKVKTGVKNVYTLLDIADVKKPQKKKGKNTLTKRVNGKQGQEGTRTVQEAQQAVVREEVAQLPATGVYAAYVKAVEVWTNTTGVKPWREAKFTEKLGKHNQEAMEIGYQIVAKSIGTMHITTAKVYLLSPDEMMTQLYPQIKKVIAGKKIEAAKEEFAAKRNTVIATALKEEKITQDDADYYLAHSRETTNKRVSQIGQVLQGVYADMGAAIAKAHGINFINNIFTI